MPTKTDRELLAAWRETGDESAFAELVARHRQMVFRTSLRMLGSVQDTEDAVQAVFVVLAQKAERLQREGSLGGWLHTVTRHVAMQALARRASHTRQEKEFAMWAETDIEASSSNVDTSAVLRCLDQELAGLSAVLRQAVVLRYLQGNSEKAAAELAGCPLGTLSWRASKGIAKLRQRLAKRGVALGGVALVGLLTSEASAAVPETLLPSILATVKTAVATTATATTTTTTAVMLAKGAMKAMFIAQVKMVAAVAAAVIVTGTAVPVGIAVAQAAEKAKKEGVTMATVQTENISKNARYTLDRKEDRTMKQPGAKNLLGPDELKNWRLTAWRPQGRMWALDDGVFHGFCSNTWVGHAECFADMVLTCEVLYDGFGGGDICVRGDRDADKTWERGYNFAIGHHNMAERTQGRVILTNPKGHHEPYIEFPTNQWITLTISAIGNRIEAFISPDQRLTFLDAENRFTSGQVCLSDQSCQKGDNCRCDGSGHIKFRNLVVTPQSRSNRD
jgi:RNA polymerase sigma factor (sigma-70 family)